MTRNATLIWLILLTALSCAASLTISTNQPISDDGCGYVMHAWRLSKGQLSTPYFSRDTDHFFPPLYPALIALVHTLVDSWIIAAKLITLLFTCLLPVMVFLFTKELVSKKAGLFAAGLVISFPLLMRHGAAEPLYLFLIFLSLLLGWRALIRRRPLMAFFTGLVLGLAYLTKSQAFVGLVGFLIIFTWFWRVHSIFNLKVYVRISASFLLGFLVLSGPYDLYCVSKDKVWRLRDRQEFFQKHDFYPQCEAYDLNKEADILLCVDQSKKVSPFEIILNQPGAFFKRGVKDISSMFSQEVREKRWLPLILFLLFILFCRKELASRLKEHVYLLLWFLTSLSLSSLFYDTSSKNLLPIYFPILIWGGCGLGALKESLPKGGYKNYLSSIFILLILILNPLSDMGDLWAKNERADQIEIEPLKHVKEKTLLCSNPFTAFSTGNYWLKSPVDNINRLSLYAKAQKADYFLWEKKLYEGGAPQDLMDQYILDFDKYQFKVLGRYDGDRDSKLDTVLYQIEEEVPEPEKPNVIFISIDTLRADHLSCYGYQRKTSPHLDRIAASGVRFHNTISQAPKTAPSHMTMFTSTYPSVHGVNKIPALADFTVLPEGLKTITELLKENGYRTAAFTGGAQVAGGFGFERGFEVYEENMLRLEWEDFDPVFEWLSSVKRDENFFLFLHNYQVHTPHCPPPPYNKLYDPDYKGKIIDDYETFIKEKKFIADEDLSRRDVIHMKALYDGEIRYTDDLLHRFFQEMEKKGLLGGQKTLLIVTSDHGEEFREHGGLTHLWLYEEVIKVPLIFYWPGVIPPGEVRLGQVRLVDLGPTILDLLGLPLSPQMQGLSLKPALLDDQEINLSAYSEENIVKRQKALRTDLWMYYQKGELGEELYSKKHDQFEQKNLIKLKSQKRKIKKITLSLRKKTEDFNQNSKRFQRILEIDSAAIPQKITMTKEQAERLKELGY